MLNMKKVYFNPDDPYYRRKEFNKMHQNVYDTKMVMNIISPRDHSGMKGLNNDDIKKSS